MVTAECPWEAIERLEARARHRTFPARWRGFARACGEAVLPDLPAEARAWAHAAAGYDRGERSAADLAALSADAWAFYQARGDADSPAVRSGLLVVMTGLGTGFRAGTWYDGAWHFLHRCAEAGLPDDLLRALLGQHFGPLLEE